MTSKTIFNMNTKLKKAAMKKARAEGWTLSAMLNNAARAYIEDRFELEILPNYPKLVKLIRKDIAEGKMIPWEDVKRELAEERSRINSRNQNANKLLSSSKKATPRVFLKFPK